MKQIKPIDKILLDLEWEVLPIPETNNENLPFPTHSGTLRLGGKELKVYQLNTGERVIDCSDLNAFFGFDVLTDASP